MSFSLDSSHLQRLLTSQASLERLMPTVLDIVLEATHAQRGFLLVHDANNELSIRAARTNSGRDLDQTEFRGSSSVVEKVLATKRAIYVPALPMDHDFSGAKSVRTGNLQSAICLPLYYSQDGELLGVLYIDSSAPAEDRLTENDLQLLEGLVNHLAVSIENAKLFQQLQDRNLQIAALNKELRQKVELQDGRITEIQAMLEDSQRELGKRYGLGNLIGKSSSMQKVFHILQKVVRTDAPVMIQGESGTGKELVAKYLHYNGPRASKPMVSINCAAFNDTLLESELFGHRKGAFTGADQHKLGLFQLAENGTLFLDEVGDMSDEMQKKLLRVLQNGEVRPVGSNDVFHVDVRIIAASNRDLKEMAEQGKFRQDLYFRLNVISIHLPALRERREDITLLIDAFSRQICDELKIALAPIPTNLLEKLLGYDWPGNVRELENELRRVYILGSDYQFDRFQSENVQHPTFDLETIEKRTILQALNATGNNKTKASELMGLPLRTLYERLKKYGI